MSHYNLQIDGRSEQQRSSGVWLSTAAGSTGAIQSAGGKKLPFNSAQIQYMPRELFEGHGVKYKLRGGVLPPKQKIRVISQMQEGAVYFDGAHMKSSLDYGDILAISPSRYDLRFIRFRPLN